MFKKYLATILLTVTVFITTTPTQTYAQEIPPEMLQQLESTASANTETAFDFPNDEFYRAKVEKIKKEGTEDISGFTREYQEVVVKIENGPEKGKMVDIKIGQLASANSQKVKEGETVIIAKSRIGTETSYTIIDRYRLYPLIALLLTFFALAIFFSRKKGFFSIVGLGISVLVIVQFIVPQIIAGRNPILVTITGVGVIALTSFYLAHGFNKRTNVALASTIITLIVSIIISIITVSVTKLNGIGSEDALYLQLGPLAQLNLRGLLLGGIIIGTLGVLDDVTTAQTATVEELKKANPNLNTAELYKRGVSVGNEHIASLVNTLFLAYAGSSLPLFILFTTSNSQPLWLTLNSEQVVEEIVRTLIGSIALILAVPISTFFAAQIYGKAKTKDLTPHDTYEALH